MLKQSSGQSENYIDTGLKICARRQIQSDRIGKPLLCFLICCFVVLIKSATPILTHYLNSLMSSLSHFLNRKGTKHLVKFDCNVISFTHLGLEKDNTSLQSRFEVTEYAHYTQLYHRKFLYGMVGRGFATQQIKLYRNNYNSSVRDLIITSRSLH